MHLSVGNRLGPYEILAPIGAGGMGEVYRARDSRLGRYVAIKVLPEHIAARASSRLRFEREARIIAALESQTEPVQVRHPQGHVETSYVNASYVTKLVSDGGYFGVGHRKRIRYVQPYNVEARKEPWGRDHPGLFDATRPLPRVSAAGGDGCVGLRCTDRTLHTRAADPNGRRGIVIRRI